MSRSILIGRRHDADERYIPSVIAFLVLLVGVALFLNAAVTVVAAISIFVDGFGDIAEMSFRHERAFVGIVPFLILFLRVSGWVLGAWLLYYIARQVIRGARWAWFVAAFFTALGMVAVVFAERLLPFEMLLLLPPWWKLALYTSGAVIIGILFVALVFDWIIGMNMSRAERRPRPS